MTSVSWVMSSNFTIPVFLEVLMLLMKLKPTFVPSEQELSHEKSTSLIEANFLEKIQEVSLGNS
jgi:hypothetical protein